MRKHSKPGGKLCSVVFLLLLAGCSKKNEVSVGGGSGPEALGEACNSSVECVGGSCVAGACRLSCEADADCEVNSLCFADGATSGCRLPGERTCDAPGKPCGNSALVCGIDGTCRMPCSSSCARPGQSCIQGACVDSAEPGVSETFFACQTDSGRSGKLCDGPDLVSCNETVAGKTKLDSCTSTALCASAAADGRATCDAAVCLLEELRCGGPNAATLQRCAPDQSGFEDVDANHVCATNALCESTRQDAVASGVVGACSPPVCAAGAGACKNGEASVCNEGRTGFDVVATCGGVLAQCDPRASECVAIVMDATEVTRDAYAAFLAAIGDPDDPGVPAASPPTQPEACKLNTEFTPTAFWSAGDKALGSAPVSGIDWCDARAYCAFSGKRLCGRIGGGSLTKADYDDPGKSEWMNMCSSGGVNTHVFGAWTGSTSEDTCNGAGNWLTTQTPVPVPVGSMLECASVVPGYELTVDLTGNVAEWEDVCDFAVGVGTPSDQCRVRGGSYLSQTSAQLSCAADRTLGRASTAPDVGFRCCD